MTNKNNKIVSVYLLFLPLFLFLLVIIAEEQYLSIRMSDSNLRMSSTWHVDIEKELTGKHPLRSIVSGLTFDGTDMVSDIRLTPKDFRRHLSMIDDKKVAEYDDKTLMDKWNSNIVHESWKTSLLNKFKHGIIRRTYPLILLYILGYYTFYLSMTIVCEKDCIKTTSQETGMEQSNQTDSLELFRLLIKDKVTNVCENQSKILEVLKTEEYHMTKIATLLIVFYVGFIIKSGWKRIIMTPSVDSVCIATGSLVLGNSKMNDNEMEFEIDNRKITISQLKKDIVRLALLSWAMCFCRISKPLRAKLSKPEAFNKKRLLTKEEFNQLKIIELNSDIEDSGCWFENWAIPLLWINKMVLSVDKQTKIKDFEGNIVQGVRFREGNDISNAVFKLKDQLDALSQQYNHKTPDLMLQCVTLVIYYVMFLGTFAAQNTVFCSDNNTLYKLISSFPLFHCVKYIVLIGWLKTAKDLQNPFGDDE